MAGKLKVALELGPKGKRVVAWAPDWPGLERSGKTAEAAIETLQAYAPRYKRVAEFADLASRLPTGKIIDVVEQYPGTGSTDYWGISFAFSDLDKAPLPAKELERDLTLLNGCWSFFDEVRRRVSSELQRGPRGGGRDRDTVVRHVVACEQDWGKKLGMPIPVDWPIIDDPGLAQWREDFCDSIRRFHAEGKLARSWPLPFLIRHTAFHILDHTWEMQDKDLTG